MIEIPVRKWRGEGEPHITWQGLGPSKPEILCTEDTMCTEKKIMSSHHYKVDALKSVGSLVFTSPIASMETCDMRSSYKADRRQTSPIVHCRQPLGPKRYGRDHICS